jgi:hypothetical protein
VDHVLPAPVWPHSTKDINQEYPCWEEPRCPSTEEWIQKIWYVYRMEYYTAIKNNEFVKFLGKWMDLEGIIMSEVIQSQKNSQEKKKKKNKNKTKQNNNKKDEGEGYH